MNDEILALAPDYGLPLLAAVVAASCLGAPLPASLVMMLMGSLSAADDFSTASVVAVALCAAIAGDQLGFAIGRIGGRPLFERLAVKPERRALLEKASDFMKRRGNVGIFVTRWLLAPLGPATNLVAGATGFAWPRFALWGAAGEAVWVGLYVGIGYIFSDNVLAVAALAVDTSGMVAAGAVAVLLGWRILSLLRHRQDEHKQ